MQLTIQMLYKMSTSGRSSRSMQITFTTLAVCTKKDEDKLSISLSYTCIDAMHSPKLSPGWGFSKGYP